jgi:hypothetical protein
MSKRKRYRLKPVNPNVLELASIGQSKLTAEDQDSRTGPPRLALEQITKGQASQADWQAIFDVINMLDRFVKMPTVMRHGKDYLNTMQGVVKTILDRQKETGTKALYPGELEDLRGLVDLWSELLATVTHREYSMAEDRAHARLVSVLRSKNPVPGVTVCEA